MQPQMTGVGSIYPVQGLALQQPQQAPTNLAAPAQQFYSSVPLANLGEGSAPADCPMCRHRTMTLTNNQCVCVNVCQRSVDVAWGGFADICEFCE